MTAVVIVALMLNAITVLLVLYLVYRGDKALGDFEPYLRDVDNTRNNIARRGNQILEKTITVAQEMIRNAVYTSQKNIKSSEALQKEMEKAIAQGINQNISESKETIQKSTAQLLDSYQQQFSLLSREIKETSDSSRQTIVDATKAHIAELSSQVAVQVEEVRKSAQEQIKQEMAQNETMIKLYRDEKLKEIDNKIYQILSAVAKKTMAKGIDLSSHEKLVLEALEKAKKEKMI